MSVKKHFHLSTPIAFFSIIILIIAFMIMLASKNNITLSSRAQIAENITVTTPPKGNTLRLTCEEKKKYYEQTQMDCDPKTVINETCVYNQIEYKTCLTPTDDTTCKGHQEAGSSEPPLLVGIPYWCGWNKSTNTTQWYVWNRYGECVDSATCNTQSQGIQENEPPKNRIVLRSPLEFDLPTEYKMYNIKNFRVVGLSYQQYQEKDKMWPRIYQSMDKSIDKTEEGSLLLSNANLLMDKKYYETAEPINLVFWAIAEPEVPNEESVIDKSLACLKSQVIEISKVWGERKNEMLSYWNYDTDYDNVNTTKKIHFRNSYLDYQTRCSDYTKPRNDFFKYNHYCAPSTVKWEDCNASKFDDMRDIINDVKVQLEK